MRLRTLVALMVFSLPLTGCMQSLAGCEEGYSEMHAGDYVESAMSMDSNGKLTVQFESEDSPGFLEASEEYQTDPNIYVTLYVEFDDGSQTSVAFRQSGWDNFGDGAGGSSWGTHLTYNSPDGFCDGGCKRVKLGTSMEYGVLYYNGTCDSSPWIDIG